MPWTCEDGRGLGRVERAVAGELGKVRERAETVGGEDAGVEAGAVEEEVAGGLRGRLGDFGGEAQEVAASGEDRSLRTEERTGRLQRMPLRRQFSLQRPAATLTRPPQRSLHREAV